MEWPLFLPPFLSAKFMFGWREGIGAERNNKATQRIFRPLVWGNGGSMREGKERKSGSRKNERERTEKGGRNEEIESKAPI